MRTSRTTAAARAEPYGLCLLPGPCPVGTPLDHLGIPQVSTAALASTPDQRRPGERPPARLGHRPRHRPTRRTPCRRHHPAHPRAAGLVTGAGSGIGRATAIELARQGAAVTVTDIDEATAAETTELIRKDGGQAQALPVDIADEDAVRTAVERTVETYGGLDFAVNNAGLDSHHRRLDQMTAECRCGAYNGIVSAIKEVAK